MHGELTDDGGAHGDQTHGGAPRVLQRLNDPRKRRHERRKGRGQGTTNTLLVLSTETSSRYESVPCRPCQFRSLLGAVERSEVPGRLLVLQRVVV